MLAYHGVRVLDEIPIGGHFIELVIPDDPTCACKMVEEEIIDSRFVACGGLSMAYVGGRWMGRSVLFGDGDSMEGWCDWRGQPGGWGSVLLGAFEMASELLCIKLFAVTVMVFDFVILIDSVK